MTDIAQHNFVPLLDAPDQCGRTGCGCFWNNYVAHNQFIDASGRPAKPPVMPATPELDKMSAVKSQSQPIGEFLEWLFSKDFHIIKYVEDEDYSEPQPRHVHKDIEQWIAEYLEIDLQKTEDEKLALINYLRASRGE